ncbi:RWD domain-containing protein 1 [Echinococcus granulosus]|nr:RWD domain-containing protein 1 [Echinococcus granulosus]
MSFMLQMSTSLEEQEGEIEVLQSIYEDNFRMLSSKSPHHFEIELRGHAVDNPDTAVSCTLYFRYSPNYPSEAPLFEIRNQRGLSDDQNMDLVVLISDTISRSLGMVMIFDVVSDVQQKLDEFTDELIAEVKSRKTKQTKIKSLAEAERETEVERCLLSGTRVTVESFNAWNKAFLAEMAKAKEAEEAKAKKLGVGGGGGQNAESMKRLTGREMFLRDDQFDDSDLTFLAQEGGKIVEVDERLFTDIGEIDLPDLEGS